MEKTLVVMAAGMGSRFGGLKQIEPVGPSGEFIIDYSVYDAKRAGFTKVVFIIKKELESVFKETIGKRVEDKIEIAYAFQEIENIPSKTYLAEKREKPWGTVQAVLSSKEYVNGNFVVINADDFYGYDSYLKAANFLDNNTSDNEYASINYPYIITASKFGSVKRAVCISDNEKITELIESKITTLDEDNAIAEPLSGDKPFNISVNQPVAVNMFAFKHTFYNYLEEYFDNFFKQDDEVILNGEALLPEVVKEKLLTNEIILHNIVSNSKWLGMTYKEDLDELKNAIRALVQKGEYPEKLWD